MRKGRKYSRYLILAIGMSFVNILMAKPTPPSPAKKGPGHNGLPIDENIGILLVLALIFAFVVLIDKKKLYKI